MQQDLILGRFKDIKNQRKKLVLTMLLKNLKLCWPWKKGII